MYKLMNHSFYTLLQMVPILNIHIVMIRSIMMQCLKTETGIQDRHGIK